MNHKIRNSLLAVGVALGIVAAAAAPAMAGTTLNHSEPLTRL